MLTFSKTRHCIDVEAQYLVEECNNNTDGGGNNSLESCNLAHPSY